MNQLVKERLTGAIILVTLIVLLVPELLTGPPRPGTRAEVAASAGEEAPLRSYTINLADDARARSSSAGSGPAMPQSSPPPEQSNTTQGSLPASSTAASSAIAPAVPNPSTATATPNARTATPTPSSGNAPAANTRRAQTEAATTRSTHPGTGGGTTPARQRGPSSGWGVQLGVFASRENAEHLAQEMRSKGFKASVADVPGASRKLYRVRVGPTADRAAALDLQGRLRATGRAGTIIPYS